MAVPTDKQIQDALAVTGRVLKNAKEAINASETLSLRIEKDLKRIREERKRRQSKLKADSMKLIQDLDEAALQFIKDTE